MQYKDYSEVPWFRKNWFIILLWLVFWPACLVLLWTGDVYYIKKGFMPGGGSGELKTYGKSAKIIMSIIAILVTLRAFGAF